MLNNSLAASFEQENRDRWVRCAPFWEQHRNLIRAMLAPITEALIEEASIVHGQTVLDVSTGPGEPALQLAELVGPAGHVDGVDPISEMIAGARRTALERGLNNLKFEVASAEHLPFVADRFDAVVCRLGAMFFTAPADAIREMLRVLKPGHKLTFAVWNDVNRNPFHYVLSQAIDRYLEPTPTTPDAWDAFRFAPSGKLQAILTEAGAQSATERILQFPIVVPLSPDEFWSFRVGLSDKFQQKITALKEEIGAQVKTQFLQSLLAFSTSEGLAFPSEVRIVSGSKLN